MNQVQRRVQSGGTEHTGREGFEEFDGVEEFDGFEEFDESSSAHTRLWLRSIYHYYYPHARGLYEEVNGIRETMATH